MRWRVLVLLAALAAADSVAPGSVTVVGNRFQLRHADGSVAPQSELAGIVFALGGGSGARRRIRIDTVMYDPKAPNGSVLLYGLSEADTTGAWHNLCQPDPDGQRLGFPLAGHFTEDGRYVPQPGQLLITCTGGAEGKCVRFGYHPWETLADGTSLVAAYNACVRLVRADYAGDGRGTTRNGQPIDIYDAFGIETHADDPSYRFEAGFTADGAVCVGHVRVPQNVTLSLVEAQAPRLAGKLGPVCTEDYARAQGAILFVRSPDPGVKP
jgi:hypothetical protein